jgi:hypothetical protein
LSNSSDTFLEHEASLHPQAIGIATTTFYPKWFPGEAGDNPISDKVRGDLALQTIHQAASQGFQVEVVDGGSSSVFLESIAAPGVIIEVEQEKGMSASRRQSFEAISAREGVAIICWTEPEKVSIVRDCVDLAVQPIIDGKADIVVPTRDKKAFSTYPEYQVEFETTSNKIWNNILRRHNLLAPGAEDLDAWIGPRLFKNDPAIVRLFTDKYRFITEKQSGIEKEAPELWPNAIFLPIIAALKQGYRVQGVPVSYVHPSEQTNNERDSEEFREKRRRQQEVILKSTVHFVRHLEENPASRMEHF